MRPVKPHSVQLVCTCEIPRRSAPRSRPRVGARSDLGLSPRRCGRHAVHSLPSFITPLDRARVSREAQRPPAAELMRELIGMSRVCEAPSRVYAMIISRASTAARLDPSLASVCQGQDHRKSDRALCRSRRAARLQRLHRRGAVGDKPNLSCPALTFVRVALISRDGLLLLMT